MYLFFLTVDKYSQRRLIIVKQSETSLITTAPFSTFSLVLYSIVLFKKKLEKSNQK